MPPIVMLIAAATVVGFVDADVAVAAIFVDVAVAEEHLYRKRRTKREAVLVMKITCVVARGRFAVVAEDTEVVTLDAVAVEVARLI
jgi:uncharacterized membrane protein YkvA (DUF1232 family)